MFYRLFICTVLSAFYLAACSLAPDYAQPDLPVPTELTANDNINLDSAGLAAQDLYGAPVKEFFKDERLQALIAISLEHNKDLKLAALSVLEAKSQYRVQKAEQLPEVSVSGSDDYRGGFGKPRTNDYEIAGMAFFELDLFGRISSMNEAALQNYLATEEAARAVRISLVAEVARAYLAERLAYERLQLTGSNLQSWKNSFAFIERRLESGQSSWLDLEQARSMVEFALADLAERERELIRAGNALSLLLGHYGPKAVYDALPEPTKLEDQRLLQLPDGIASGVLLKRPDVLQAEHMLMAENANIGAARAAFFPSISLTGNLGYMSDDLGLLVRDANSFWSLLPQISLPIFSGGRNKANLDIAELRKEMSIARYEKTIQIAFNEVADTLLSRGTFTRQYTAQQRYLQTQRQVLKLALASYASGIVSYLEVLAAERGVFEAEQNLLGIRQAQLNNDITLYAALGGGLN
ncbi:MAG: efflux transporter outer membrane subunit [Deltaproteobacteria bacterium]|jgi:Cu(I)/Ag(I) efflux system outer membrane protein|nr:efflux transporter outer membrane subunit [Deltaproteobacteria bacterium]